MQILEAVAVVLKERADKTFGRGYELLFMVHALGDPPYLVCRYLRQWTLHKERANKMCWHGWLWIFHFVTHPTSYADT
jgi:hypothetical protein